MREESCWDQAITKMESSLQELKRKEKFVSLILSGKCLNIEELNGLTRKNSILQDS